VHVDTNIHTYKHTNLLDRTALYEVIIMFCQATTGMLVAAVAAAAVIAVGRRKMQDLENDGPKSNAQEAT